jgi:cell pole-organizing protein PopZ
MAEARPDQEPSIEEILASIREIISDDDEAEKQADAQPAEPTPAPAAIAEPEPAQEEADDILDLAAFAQVPEPRHVPEENTKPLAGIDLAPRGAPMVDFTDPEARPEPEPEAEPEAEIEPEQPAPAPAPAPARAASPAPAAAPLPESLLTETAKAASVDSLARLAQNIAISRGNGGTLEDIVREMLKPMLRDWLDRNLPPMIERMVERELERLVKQAMDR